MFGVIAAVPTPINLEGEPLIETFLSHCSWVLENGCNGINLLGSTGEATSLSLNQRKLVMSEAAKILDIERLMVGTGSPSLSETIHLTKTADDLGYKVALVLPPFYYKPVTNQGVFSWYAKLHEKLGSREIKIYFYNFPQMTGLSIPIETIEKLHTKWPNRFNGIKDSSGNLDYCRILAKNENFRVFPSSEVSILEAHKSNFSGCISATTNQTSHLSADAWKKKHTNIDSLASKMKELREEISKNSLIPSIKYLVAQRTQNKNWENVIPPFVKLDEKRQSELSILYNKFLS